MQDTLPGYLEEGDGYAVACFEGVTIPGASGVLAEKDNPALIEQLEKINARVEAAGAIPAITVVDNSAPKLVAEAQRLGLTDVAPSQCMTIREHELKSEHHSDLDIFLVETPSDFDAMLELTSGVFGTPIEALEKMSIPELSKKGISKVYAGKVRNEIVTTASFVIAGGVAAITNVATPEQHRGKGYGGAVTSHAVEQAFRAGLELVGLQAEPKAISLYLRLGFRKINMYKTYTRPTPDS